MCSMLPRWRKARTCSTSLCKPLPSGSISMRQMSAIKGSVSESRSDTVREVTARAPRSCPAPGSDFLWLCPKCRTPLKSEVARTKHQKNLVKFTAGAALGKWSLAYKYVWLYIHTCVCTNTCAEHFPVALKQCFQQNFHEKFKGMCTMWRSRSGAGAGESRWPGIFRPVIFSAHRWGILNRGPAGTCQAQPPRIAEEGRAPEPPASTRESYNKPIQDTVLGSSPNSSPCSGLAVLRFPSLVSCLERLGRTHGRT